MKKIWFKRKQYGWGWYPATWQGWAVLGVYIIAITKSLILAGINSHSTSDTIISFVLSSIIFTLLLITTCYVTGEEPKWQWGKRDIDKRH